MPPYAEPEETPRTQASPGTARRRPQIQMHLSQAVVGDIAAQSEPVVRHSFAPMSIFHYFSTAEVNAIRSHPLVETITHAAGDSPLMWSGTLMFMNTHREWHTYIPLADNALYRIFTEPQRFPLQHKYIVPLTHYTTAAENPHLPLNYCPIAAPTPVTNWPTAAELMEQAAQRGTGYASEGEQEESTELVAEYETQEEDDEFDAGTDTDDEFYNNPANHPQTTVTGWMTESSDSIIIDGS